MALSDLEMVLGWAKDEGWNPGLSDAAAFFASDLDGFFLAEVDGNPAAAISVVNHDEEYAFLGLYICRAQFRGQGIGRALWVEALKHAENRSVILEGVLAQQENYARSGFRLLGQTVRYEGKIDDTQSEADVATLADQPVLANLDHKALGYRRPAFSNVWFKPTVDRQTMVLRKGSQPTAYATFRRCANGTKIGPLFASTEAEARRLLAAHPFDRTEALFIDVPTSCTLLTRLLKDAGFLPVFETAQMVLGDAARCDLPAYSAVATLELG